jgi:predicted RNA-binding Zn-ribbon protein involved in translation (DUF1610 family)
VHGLLIVFPYLLVPGLAAVVIVALVVVQGQRLQGSAAGRLAGMGCPKCGAAIAAERAASARADWEERTRRAHAHAKDHGSLVRVDPLWRFHCAACGAALIFDPASRNPPVDQGMNP